MIQALVFIEPLVPSGLAFSRLSPLASPSLGMEMPPPPRPPSTDVDFEPGRDGRGVGRDHELLRWSCAKRNLWSRSMGASV